MQAAPVNPLDDVVRAGQFPLAKRPPLVLGDEGVGVVIEPGSSSFAPGTRVMVSGPYGVLQDGTWQEYLLAQPRELAPVPDGLSDAAAAGVPIAYLTAQLALTVAGGFVPGKSVLVPGVGGAVGNAAVQLAGAQGAARVITSAGSNHKAEQARAAGYVDVINLTHESLSAGVARLTGGAGVDVAIDSIGGHLTGEALASLGQGGTLVTLGYPAGTRASMNVTDLIWKATRVVGFNLFVQQPETVGEAYTAILSLLADRRIKPLVARTFPLDEAAAAQRYLKEERPFGKVVLTF